MTDHYRSFQSKRLPIIATGFTSAYLGDERSLREFVVGDHVRNKLIRQGENAVLYLVNDSYDPLNERQLRIGVNKNEKLISQFSEFCGRPIAEVPDPYDCHASYAEHFVDALLARLRSLDIHPVLLDTYRSYRSGYYAPFVAATFDNYSRIQHQVSEAFNAYTLQNLFNVQCPRCRCLDLTRIRTVVGQEVRFHCYRCSTDFRDLRDNIQGKLSWKLDCAARWNIYSIDFETFSKSHLSPLGSFEISRFLSEQFYGGRVPTPIKYGHLKIHREMSYKLLEILPPKIFKMLLTARMTRDVEISKDSVENFCRNAFVKPGLSYVQYVHKNLPLWALADPDALKGINGSRDASTVSVDEKELIDFGNRFSSFYYGKDYSLRLPDHATIASCDLQTVRVARKIVSYSVAVRTEDKHDPDRGNELIQSFMRAHPEANNLVHQYLRKVVGVTEGPRVTSLLKLLPIPQLQAVEMFLRYYGGEHLPSSACERYGNEQQDRCRLLGNIVLQTETELKTAVARSEFILHYQPIVNLPASDVVGFEALLRWHHPTRGLLAPGEFLSVAEETGIIVPIGHWVLEEACRQMRAWQDELPAARDMFVSVNISTTEFGQHGFLDHVYRVLESTRLDPGSLKLEITEHVLIKNIDTAAKVLSELRNAGIQLSIDDFGTGYSSLSYLHQFPFDVLKIDRSFIKRLDKSSDGLEIVRAIVTLAHDLGMTVVAEGSETFNEVTKLKSLFCEYAQGHVFSEPLDKDDAAAVIVGLLNDRLSHG